MVPCSVVELRQYTLHPGRRGELITLFERELLETQEAVGIRVLGQFEDVEAPDRFVWFRGFPDTNARRQALTAFYDGPVWRAHREAANATMIDSDDNLLLRPLHPVDGFPRRSPGARGEPTFSRVLVRILHRAAGAEDLAGFFREHVRPALEGTGGAPVAWLEARPGVNDIPRFPIRTDVDGLVAVSVFPDETALRRHLALLAADLHWAEEVGPALRGRLSAEPEQRVLRPTPRSGLW